MDHTYALPGPFHNERRRRCQTDPGPSNRGPRLSLRSRRMCQTDPGLAYSNDASPDMGTVRILLLFCLAAIIFPAIQCLFNNAFLYWTTPNEAEPFLPSTLNPSRPLMTVKEYRTPSSPLQSHDAEVLQSRSSKTYNRNGFMEDVFNWLMPKYGLVLKPHSELTPYICWPFQGAGHIHIKLANPTHITDVTLGHITKSQTPNGEVTSAPRVFSVYGMVNLDDDETFLGQFEYDRDGPSFQAFPITSTGPFKHVRLNVETNWGNEEYTCLYNFGVHGRPAEP